MTSIAGQIRALCEDNPSNVEVAAIVGCKAGYVNVIRNQRKASGMSQYDARYLLRKHRTQDLTEARTLERAEMRARAR